MVDDIAGHLTAEAALQVGHRNVALAETGNLVSATDFLEVGFYFFFVVVFSHLHLKAQAHGINVVSCYIHLNLN